MLALAAPGIQGIYGNLFPHFRPDDLRAMREAFPASFYFFAVQMLLSGVGAVFGLIFLGRGCRVIIDQFRGSRRRMAVQRGFDRYPLASSGRRPRLISHWHHSIEEFNTSSLEFFDQLSIELAAIAAPVRIARVEWNESGFQSDKRLYLRLELNRLTFDISAAPFGRAFFFSWWLAERQPAFPAFFVAAVLVVTAPLTKLAVEALGLWQGLQVSALVLAGGWVALASTSTRVAEKTEDLWLSVPGVSYLYRRFIRPSTYYSEDTRIVFEEVVHNAVLRVVDWVLNAKGARQLAPEARKPLPAPRF